MSNLYSTLGVDKNASQNQIKKAYKKLASKYHPDKNPDDPKAKACFQAIQEAYDVLSVVEKRNRYDRTGQVTDEGPTKEEVAITLIFDLFIWFLEKRNYQTLNYFKQIRDELKDSIKDCQKDLDKTQKNIEQLEYIHTHSHSSSLLDRRFEEKKVELSQHLCFCEHGKECLNEAILILDTKCKWTGKQEPKEEKLSESLQEKFFRELTGQISGA